MGKTAKEEEFRKSAKLKAARYCAYRERTQREVREKLHSYGLGWDAAEEVISELITEGFINEERFAIAYASGKFRLKKWGKLKIQQGLESHGLTNYCIKKALGSIEDPDYHQTLRKLISEKWRKLEIDDLFVRRHKAAQYVMSKGYEPDLIWEILKEPIED